MSDSLNPETERQVRVWDVTNVLELSTSEISNKS
jgi:hypothetical protein